MPSFLLGGGSVVCYLIWGDGNVRAKLILAAALVASFGLLFVPRHGYYLFHSAQITFLVLVLLLVFGIDWLLRFRRRWP